MVFINNFTFGQAHRHKPRDFCSFNVISNVNLFILTVSPIIRGAHWKQHHIFSCCFLEGESYWNTSSFSGKIRINSINHLGCSGSGHIVRMIWVRQPTSTSMEHLCSHLVWTLSCGPNFVAIFHNYILNNLWSLVWHNSDGKLASNLSWNHSFCSRISKGSLDTMK